MSKLNRKYQNSQRTIQVVNNDGNGYFVYEDWDTLIGFAADEQQALALIPPGFKPTGTPFNYLEEKER